MPAESFGRRITHGDAKAYFDRYIAMKKKHGVNLRSSLEDDLDAQRFFCGRHGQDPALEDWYYVFDRDSFSRLMKLIEDTGADSLVIFSGIRNKEQNDQPEESDGRPTLLVFPAKFIPTVGEGDYEIGTEGEEHPGSGGRNGNDVDKRPLELPKIVLGKEIHRIG
jgi:hypothetical protein